MLYSIRDINLDPNTKIVYLITANDVQAAAREQIDRELTDDELYRAAKGIQYGLSEGENDIVTTAIEDAIEV